MDAPAPRGLKIVEWPTRVEASLWRRLRFEDQAICREAIFTRYHELAKGIATMEFRRRPPYGLERIDFEQLAYRGLLEAIDRFDPLRGPPFSAFARPRIRGAISDALALSSDAAARYSERRRLERERLHSVAAGADANDGDPVARLSDIAIALAIGFLIEDAASSLDPGYATGVAGYHGHEWTMLQGSALEEIGRLPDTERVVLQQHYLNGVSFKLIAEMLGLSKGRISQLHHAALKKLRARLKTPNGDPA